MEAVHVIISDLKSTRRNLWILTNNLNNFAKLYHMCIKKATAQISFLDIYLYLDIISATSVLAAVSLCLLFNDIFN